MNEQDQILYMQTRLLQMVSERWKLSLKETARMFRKYRLAEMIEENFDLYHMEGDESVYYDLMACLKSKGVDTHDTVAG